MTTLLLTVYLFSTTAISELLKLPLLVEHFADHQQENDQVSVLSFVIMHYITENGTDQDADEDSRLPFNSAEHAVVLSFDSVTPPYFDQLKKPESELADSFTSPNPLFLPSQFLASIWQPPRTC